MSASGKQSTPAREKRAFRFATMLSAHTDRSGPEGPFFKALVSLLRIGFLSSDREENYTQKKLHYRKPFTVTTSEIRREEGTL